MTLLSKLKPKQKEGDVTSQHSHARSKALSVNANDRDAAARPRAFFSSRRGIAQPFWAMAMAQPWRFQSHPVITCPGQENWNANPLVN